jgi:hypothetical protein
MQPEAKAQVSGPVAEGRDTADYWLRVGMLLGFSFAVWWFLF